MCAAAAIGVISAGICTVAVGESMAQSLVNVKGFRAECRKHGTWGQWEVDGDVLYGSRCRGHWATMLRSAMALDDALQRSQRGYLVTALAICDPQRPECFVRGE